MYYPIRVLTVLIMGIKGYSIIYKGLCAEPFYQGKYGFVIQHPDESGPPVLLVDFSTLIYKHTHGAVHSKLESVRSPDDAEYADEDIARIFDLCISEITEFRKANQYVVVVLDGRATAEKLRKRKYVMAPDTAATTLPEIKKCYKDSKDTQLSVEFCDEYVKNVQDLDWADASSTVLGYAKNRNNRRQIEAWSAVWDDLEWSTRNKIELAKALVKSAPPPSRQLIHMMHDLVAEDPMDIYGHWSIDQADGEADFRISELVMESTGVVHVLSVDSDLSCLSRCTRKWSQRYSTVNQDSAAWWDTAMICMLSQYGYLRDGDPGESARDLYDDELGRIVYPIERLKMHIDAFFAKYPESATAFGDTPIDRYLCSALGVMAALYYNVSDYHLGLNRHGPAASIRDILDGHMECTKFATTLPDAGIKMWLPAMARIAQYYRTHTIEMTDTTIAYVTAGINDEKLAKSERKRRFRTSTGWSKKWVTAAIAYQQGVAEY